MTGGKAAGKSWLPLCLFIVGAALWLPQVKVVVVSATA